MKNITDDSTQQKHSQQISDLRIKEASLPQLPSSTAMLNENVINASIQKNMEQAFLPHDWGHNLWPSSTLAEQMDEQTQDISEGLEESKALEAQILKLLEAAYVPPIEDAQAICDTWGNIINNQTKSMRRTSPIFKSKLHLYAKISSAWWYLENEKNLLKNPPIRHINYDFVPARSIEPGDVICTSNDNLGDISFDYQVLDINYDKKTFKVMLMLIGVETLAECTRYEYIYRRKIDDTNSDTEV